eukprot:GILJ01030026.1.p2 GENE.GILJ01030026.1~~GILJ01030026.1.p2  ORF type:complete len:110 (-),score=5.77 GILJ01030026.1:86-415(-)
MPTFNIYVTTDKTVATVEMAFLFVNHERSIYHIHPATGNKCRIITNKLGHSGIKIFDISQRLLFLQFLHNCCRVLLQDSNSICIIADLNNDVMERKERFWRNVTVGTSV